MTLFKNRYRIESARLQGYDYSQCGAYFITICTKYRVHYFGKIVNKKMVLNKMGKIVNKYWYEIPDHFPSVVLDEFVVMPNHVHGIIHIVIETPKLGVSITKLGISTNISTKKPTIGVIINQYKRICTINIKKQGFNFAWQSRFHDHIVRNNDELNRIRNYISKNPRNWKIDNNYHR